MTEAYTPTKPERITRYLSDYGKTLAASDANDTFIREVAGGKRTIEDYIAYRRGRAGHLPDHVLERTLPEGTSLAEHFTREYRSRLTVLEAAEKATAQDMIDIVTTAQDLLRILKGSPHAKYQADRLRSILQRIGIAS